MATYGDYARAARKAIDNQALEAFLSEHSAAAEFWEWLNSDSLEFSLLLAVAQALSDPKREKLKPSRRLLLAHYEAAASSKKVDSRSLMLNKISDMRHAKSTWHATQEDFAEATMFVLQTAMTPPRGDHNIAAVFYFHVIVGGSRLSSAEPVIDLIRRMPEAVSSRDILSAMAYEYGPKLIQMAATACLAAREDSDALRSILKGLTGISGAGKEFGVYGREVLTWYYDNKESLDLNARALYPAPPFIPLFKPGTKK